MFFVTTHNRKEKRIWVEKSKIQRSQKLRDTLLFKNMLQHDSHCRSKQISKSHVRKAVFHPNKDVLVAFTINLD